MRDRVRVRAGARAAVAADAARPRRQCAARWVVTRREILVAALLICIGCVQMAGDVFRVLPLKAFGAATHASPAPKVFTAQDGFETYANRFHLEWRDATGATQSLELTPETYAGISGPYNRRNVYGAVFSYAPVLEANPATRLMFRTVLRRGLCGSPSVLRSEEHTSELQSQS